VSARPSIDIEYTDIATRIEWARKISHANNLPRLERETVKHGLRPCGLLFGLDPARLDELVSQYAGDGLVLQPIARMAVVNEAFRHFATPPGKDEAYRLKCVIARGVRDAQQFRDADRERDDISIGEMLGYPPCCTRFFASVWRQGFFDPIWQTAENTPDHAIRSRSVRHDGHGNAVETSIVLAPNPEGCKISSCLRYIGVRITSHFACAANCATSIAIANQRIDLARRLQMSVDPALELLRLPCRWECQDGMAHVSTPAFRFHVQSMPYKVKHTVQQEASALISHVESLSL
jgi:hypothetical protein